MLSGTDSSDQPSSVRAYGRIRDIVDIQSPGENVFPPPSDPPDGVPLVLPGIDHPSSLLIRYVHVLGMAILVGGAALAWVAFGSEFISDLDGSDLVHLAAAYEWLFWAGIGLLVVTGVGNFGSLAPAIPAPTTAWGTTFGVKLLAIVGLVVGSLPRTLAVVRWLSVEDTPLALDRFRLGYAATALYLLGVVALGEVLAHG